VSNLKIGIIIGSTRPGRKGDQVAKWVLEQAQERGGADYELVDLLDYALPHLDEAVPASQGQYANSHTQEWAAKIDSLDGFVFVTPEYNHSTSGALKNAIDFIYAEWNNKAAGFVSYGAAAAGARAVEHLRLIVGELQIADVRSQVGLSLITDFEQFTTLKAGPQHARTLDAMLDQLESWSGALQGVREEKLAQAA
jgi:NAD(P)H-dependent FMN reductase